MQKTILLFVLLFHSLYIFSQKNPCNQVLYLKILDASTGLAIEDVTAFIPSVQKGNHSNANGELKIESLCEGDYELVCKHLNHEQKIEKVHISNKENFKTIYLSCHTDTIHNIVIKGAKLHVENTQVINKIEGKDLFASQGLSLGKALEKVNGVYNLSTGNNINKPIIRGLHSNRVLILNNEIRQEEQQWGNEHAPEIDQFVAKHIEVIKGAQTIQYGSDVIGGVILVTPNPLQKIEGTNIEWNSSFMSNGKAFANSVMIESKLKKIPGIAFRLQGTYKRAGNAQTPDYFLKNTGMKELNYSGAIGYKRNNVNIELFHSYFNTDLGIFAGSHIGNLTDLYNAFNASRPIDSSGFSYVIDFPYQHVVHQLTKVNASYRLKNIGMLHFIYGFQQNTRKEFDKNITTLQPDGSYIPSLFFVLKTHNYDMSFVSKKIKNIETSLGINGFAQTNEYHGAYFIPNYYKNLGGIYLLEKWHKNAFSVEGAVRYDINNFGIKKWENNLLIEQTRTYKGFAASTAFRYQFPFITTHLNLATTWRAPFVNELYSYGVHHSAASFEIGDSTLIPERSYNTAFTIDFNYKNKFQGEITLYNNYIKNFINMQPILPATLTIRGAFPTFQYIQSNVNMSGIEFSATKSITAKWLLYTRGNVLYVKDVSNNRFVYGMPPARFELENDFILYSKNKNNLHLSITGSYTLKQNRYNNGDDYVPPPPAYFLLNNEIYSEINIAHQTIKVGFSINNMLNTRYRDYLNRNRYFVNEIGRNFSFRLSIPIKF